MSINHDTKVVESNVGDSEDTFPVLSDSGTQTYDGADKITTGNNDNHYFVELNYFK